MLAWEQQFPVIGKGNKMKKQIYLCQNVHPGCDGRGIGTN